MSDTYTSKKVTDLTENTSVSDTDLMLVGNAGTANLRRITFANVAAKIKEKIASWAYDTLTTTNKTLPGAINELNTKIAKNVLGAGIDLKEYTSTYYTFPSDGYVCVLLGYDANQYVYADIVGSSGSTLNIHLSTGADGHFGNTALPVFVRSGMKFKISMKSDGATFAATFIPFV